MRIKREQLVFLVLAGGFFTLAFEVRQLHRDVLSEHWQAWIPIYFSFLAFLASLGAAASTGFLRLLSAAIYAMGCVVGVLGLYFHSDGEPTRIVEPFMGSIIAQAKDRDDRDDRRGRGRGEEGDPPPLAPAGITGLSAIGLILAWPKRRDEFPP